MSNSNPTQTQRVLSCLKNGGRITQLDAWQRLGVMRLAARCQELRDAGHDVRTEMIEVRIDGVKNAEWRRIGWRRDAGKNNELR